MTRKKAPASGSDWTPTDTLTDWSVRYKSDLYMGPEMAHPRLCGMSAKRGGKPVTTSRIVGSRGRLVRTSSGSVYRLGRVLAPYRKWMREQGLVYDAKRPVKWKGQKSGDGDDD